MRRANARSLAASIVFAGVSLVALEAGAADRPVGAPAKATTLDAPSVGVHPLSAMQSWWGGSFQIAPATHQALILSVSHTTSTATIPDASQPRGGREIAGSSIGGELGWFVYTGRPSTSGLWAGPSLLARPMGYTTGNAEIAHTHALGVVVDAGAQVVTRSGLNVSVGYGLQFLAHGVPSQKEPQVLPRLVLALSWSI